MNSQISPERLGVYGGTFDPIHNGHLGAMHRLSSAVDFDTVHWILSARPPHRQPPQATVLQRLEMMRLALGDEKNAIIDDREIGRAAKSYMWHTVQELKIDYPDRLISLILGADSFATLPTWYRYLDLLNSVHWIVMSRPGYKIELPDELVDRVSMATTSGSVTLFEECQFDISATKIRSLLNTGSEESLSRVQQYLPPRVFSYIQEEKLYGNDPQKN